MPPSLSLSPAVSALAISAPSRIGVHKLVYASSQVTQDASPSNQTSPSGVNKTGVIVIGGGLAGLAAATCLRAENVPFVLLEASEAVGGRVRSDVVDGFILDRGFQIFITAYPEARRLLNYDALELRKFYSGARIYYGGRFHTVADPLRHLPDALSSLANPIGSVVDKLLIGLTRVRVSALQDDEILTADEVTTYELLKRIGFSDSMVERFFRPFFGGIFFELVSLVLEELSGWFGEAVVGAWRYLRMYRIGFAQPNQSPPTNLQKNPRVRSGLFLCGDFVTSATFDDALASGRKAVEALLKDRSLFQI